MVFSLWQYEVSADIRGGNSLEMGHQTTVGWLINCLFTFDDLALKPS